MFKKLRDLFSSKNTLYYPGCLTHTVLPEIESNYMKILDRLGIDFIVLKDEINCCGSPAINAGYSKDFEELKAKNNNLLKQYSVGKIITNCPACYHVLKNRYDGLEVLHITQVICHGIKKLNLKAGNTEIITYHDPCHLGRHSNIYDEPRDIIRSMGHKVQELPKSRAQSLCCGGGAGLRSNYKYISDTVAKNIIKVIKTKRLVTTCPLCYAHLKENTKGTGIEILELSELIIQNIK